MLMVLSSRREGRRRKRWEDLHVVKRIFHRIRHLFGLGLVSILIGFCQVYVEVTNYDAYALRAYLELVNGELEGLGVLCLAPPLRSLLGRLLGRLILPICVLVLTSSSIYIANMIYNCQCSRKRRLRLNDEVDRSGDDDDFGFGDMSDGGVGVGDLHSVVIDGDFGNEAQHLVSIQSLNHPMKSSSPPTGDFDSVSWKESKRYPASALASNVGLSVLRFFYFNVALASTEFFFFTVAQKCSGDLYIQSRPGVLYSESSRLRLVSIPFLVLYVGGFPLAFGMLVLKFGRSGRFEMFLGSIVGRYRTSVCCWWEVVLLLRKLSLALVLRGFSISNSLYSGSIQLILCSHLFLQILLKPWKHWLDNFAEIGGSILIILSQTAAQSGVEKRSNSGPWQFALLSVVVLFVLSQAVIIIVETLRTKTDYQVDWEREHAFDLNPDPPAESLHKDEQVNE